jgi:hypothetical protein
MKLIMQKRAIEAGDPDALNKSSTAFHQFFHIDYQINIQDKTVSEEGKFIIQNTIEELSLDASLLKDFWEDLEPSKRNKSNN